MDECGGARVQAAEPGGVGAGLDPYAGSVAAGDAAREHQAERAVAVAGAVAGVGLDQDAEVLPRLLVTDVEEVVVLLARGVLPQLLEVLSGPVPGDDDLVGGHPPSRPEVERGGLGDGHYGV